MRGRNFLERKLSPPPPFSKNFAKRKLLIKEKARSTNGNQRSSVLILRYSIVERTMCAKAFPFWKVFGATFFQKGSKKHLTNSNF